MDTAGDDRKDPPLPLHLTPKLAIVAGAATLGLAGIAGAVTAPDAAQPGLSKAAEQVGVELPASRDAHPTADERAEHDENVDKTEGTTAEATEVEVEHEHADNHGSMVSEVAHTDHATGREHGEAVSAAAQQNGGAEARAEAAERGGDDEDEDEGDDE